MFLRKANGYNRALSARVKKSTAAVSCCGLLCAPQTHSVNSRESFLTRALGSLVTVRFPKETCRLQRTVSAEWK